MQEAYFINGNEGCLTRHKWLEERQNVPSSNKRIYLVDSNGRKEMLTIDDYDSSEWRTVKAARQEDYGDTWEENKVTPFGAPVKISSHSVGFPSDLSSVTSFFKAVVQEYVNNAMSSQPTFQTNLCSFFSTLSGKPFSRKVYKRGEAKKLLIKSKQTMLGEKSECLQAEIGNEARVNGAGWDYVLEK